jgi:nicotinamidase-related amidase
VAEKSLILAASHDAWTRPEFAKAALITIDVQRDTLDGQPFEIPGTTQALPQITALCEAFRQRSRPILHVIRLYKSDGSNAELCRREAIKNGETLFLAGSAGRLLADELLPEGAPEPDDKLLLNGDLQLIAPHEWYIYKSRWGAFYRTSLQEHLLSLGVTTVVLAGCNYPNCIRATVYEASERDFRVVAITDGISNFTEHGWNELRSIGVNVMATRDCILALDSK